MKILQVMATSGGVGGLEAHSFNLSRGLNQAGHEVHLLIDQRYEALDAQLKGVHLHCVDFAQSRWNPVLIFKIFKLIQQVQPELVHAQGGKASKIISFLQPWLKVPTVATVHGMKNHVRDYQRFDRLICVSQHVADKFNYRSGVSVIHNGVDLLPQQTSTDQAITSERAIAIGRLDAVKGFDRLIQAWQGVDYRLDIIGEGAAREKLEQLIVQFDLQDRVRLLGFQSAIADEIRNCSFVIVSSLKEGGPIVVAEALLLHTPVVATDVGMAKEFIPAAYIAADAEVQSLQQLIHTTLAQRSRLAHDFEPAYQKAAASLTLKAMCQKTIAVYQQLRLNRTSD